MSPKSALPMHGADHCPGGPDPLPCLPETWPWVALVNNGQTLPGDGAFDPSLMTQVYWDPAITPNPTTAGGTDPFGVAVVIFGGTNYWQLTLRQEGWFMFEIVHDVDSAGNGGPAVFFQQRVSQATSVAIPLDARLGYSAEWGNAGGSEIEVQPWIETYRTIWAPSSPQIYEPQVRQNTGVNKIVSGHMKVWYLRGLGGSTDNVNWSVATA